jgi:hypothetical protein
VDGEREPCLAMVRRLIIGHSTRRGQAHLMLWIRDFKFLDGKPDRRVGVWRLHRAELDRGTPLMRVIRQRERIRDFDATLNMAGIKGSRGRWGESAK